MMRKLYILILVLSAFSFEANAKPKEAPKVEPKPEVKPEPPAVIDTARPDIVALVQRENREIIKFDESTLQLQSPTNNKNGSTFSYKIKGEVIKYKLMPTFVAHEGRKVLATGTVTKNRSGWRTSNNRLLQLIY